jgi:hypothetical protein
LFVIRPSVTCRRPRNTHYTPGVPSLSGVLSSFLPGGTFCVCESDLQSNDSNCCQPAVEAPTDLLFLARHSCS